MAELKDVSDSFQFCTGTLDLGAVGMTNRLMGDGYSPLMRLVAITDAAQDGAVVAYVPLTQVQSLLAHLNGLNNE